MALGGFGKLNFTSLSGLALNPPFGSNVCLFWIQGLDFLLVALVVFRVPPSLPALRYMESAPGVLSPFDNGLSRAPRFSLPRGHGAGFVSSYSRACRPLSCDQLRKLKLLFFANNGVGGEWLFAATSSPRGEYNSGVLDSVPGLGGMEGASKVGK